MAPTLNATSPRFGQEPEFSKAVTLGIKRIGLVDLS